MLHLVNADCPASEDDVHHFAFSHLHMNRTGIAGVDEILPGESAVEAGTATRSSPPMPTSTVMAGT